MKYLSFKFLFVGLAFTLVACGQSSLLPTSLDQEHAIQDPLRSDGVENSKEEQRIDADLTWRNTERIHSQAGDSQAVTLGCSDLAITVATQEQAYAACQTLEGIQQQASQMLGHM